MMSIESIHAMSQRAAKQAARDKKLPFAVEAQDLSRWLATVGAGHLPRLPFPNIGDWRPRGFTFMESVMVDSSGFGEEGERALTVGQFIKSIKVGLAYAIVEAGQFQIYIGIFRPTQRTK